MKEKFMRIFSPISLTVIAILDIAVLSYGIFAIKKLIQYPHPRVIFFAAAEVFALIIAVVVTREELTHGVKFYDDEFEFTAIDNDNIFSYEDVLQVETKKDTAPSLVKNFIDRSSQVILTLKDGRTVSLDIGLTTKNCVERIAAEIRERTGLPNKEPQESTEKSEQEEKKNSSEENNV